MATSVIINNQHSQPPQPQTPTFIAVHSNQWSTGICDCFDDFQVCCFAFWCFPCFACTTTSEFGECFCLPMLDGLWSSTQLVGVPTCIPPVSMSMRVAVRTRYGIQGDMKADCVNSTFCNICSWCQMAREIKRRRQTFTVINAQPTMLPGQPMLMASQPGVITSQPMITSAPQAILSTRLM
ncbi:placenta-specific gene 8 protein-like [Oncorhynchus masou masou]|uniref:placenta-specific gene 8 protein-like n=1 Tax=Oncorhynchus masou masou TaxID=90313 RepID=UPI003183E6B1